MELFRGHPVVHVHYADLNLRFVFDTGSDANWLFVPGQDKSASIGDFVEEDMKITATRQKLTIRKAKVLHNMSIGGRDSADVRFLLPDPQSTFGDHAAPEDGILGLGALAKSGQVIMDFPAAKFLLRESRSLGATQSGRRD